MTKKKLLIRILVGCMAALVLLIVFPALGIEWYGARQWEKAEANLRARGEPVTLQEIIPPPISDAENFALSPFLTGIFADSGTPEFITAKARTEAWALPSKTLPPPKMNVKSEEPFDAAAWQKYVHASPEFQLAPAYGAPLADIRQAIINLGAPLDEVARDLREQPRMRAPVKYERTFAMSLPHLTVLDKLSALYSLRAITSIRLGNSGDSLQDIQTILLLARASEPSQTLIGHLVASTIEAKAATAIREGLATHVWNDAQLQELAAEISTCQPLAQITSALGKERAAFFHFSRQLGSDPARTLGELDPTSMLKLTGANRIPKGIWLADRAYYSQYMQQMMDGVLDTARGRVHVAKAHELEARFKEEDTFPQRMLHLLSSISLPVFSTLQVGAAETTARLNSAQVAIALERCRLVHQSWPTQLAALQPGFLPQIPLDPIDGQPLRYRLEPDGRYRIWSIGWNEKDDDGVADKAREKGDWVWVSLPLPQ
ncbi:MAG: hypothetical protein ABIT76_12185 [Chthoniobacterales bacterium]